MNRQQVVVTLRIALKPGKPMTRAEAEAWLDYFTKDCSMGDITVESLTLDDKPHEEEQ